MNKPSDFDALRRDYRELRAPAYLKSRINANLPQPRSWRWLPAGAIASVLVVAGLFWAGVPPETTTIRVSSPSLARISGAVPEKPRKLTLSLSGIRVPAKPPAPARPSPSKAEPQAGLATGPLEQLS